MKIDFSFDTQYGKFCDALHLPDDHMLSEAEIAQMEALAAQEQPPEE